MDSYKTLLIFINLLLFVFLVFDAVLIEINFFGDIKVRFFGLKHLNFNVLLIPVVFCCKYLPFF